MFYTFTMVVGAAFFVTRVRRQHYLLISSALRVNCVDLFSIAKDGT